MAFRGSSRIAVVDSSRQVVHHVDVQRAAGGAAVHISGQHTEMLAEAIDAIGRRMGIVAIEGIAVADYPGACVITGDGQGVAQAGGDGLRKTRHHPAADHADAAHVQALQTIKGRYSKSAALGQRRSIRAAASGQVLLVNGKFTTIDLQAVQGHRVVIVVHLQHQIGRTGVAIGVGQGVGEGVGSIAAPAQREERRVGGMQGIGVRTIRCQHQGAVGSSEGAGRDRPGSDPVGALHVVAQHIASQAQQAFRSGPGIAVVDRRGQVVHHVHIQ